MQKAAEQSVAFFAFWRLVGPGNDESGPPALCSVDARGCSPSIPTGRPAYKSSGASQKHRTNIMAEREYSKFQQKVIRNYYDNREQIDSTKLSELVTNLYLAETEKKKTKLWENAQKLMERLEVTQSRIDHVVGTQDPAILAAVVQDLQKGVIGPGKGKRPSKTKPSE